MRTIASPLSRDADAELTPDARPEPGLRPAAATTKTVTAARSVVSATTHQFDVTNVRRGPWAPHDSEFYDWRETARASAARALDEGGAAIPVAGEAPAAIPVA
jgi:hypothetical protein